MYEKDIKQNQNRPMEKTTWTLWVGWFCNRKKNDFEKEKKNSIAYFIFVTLTRLLSFFSWLEHRSISEWNDAVVVVAYKAAENIMKEGTWLQ